LTDALAIECQEVRIGTLCQSSKACIISEMVKETSILSDAEVMQPDLTLR